MFKNKRRIVDLSHTMESGKERYGLETKRYFVDELWPEYTRNPKDWYIVHQISLNSHIGTHIEMPQHYFKKGKDVVQMPLERLVGEAICLKFTNKKAGEAIDVDDFKPISKKINKGDIVFINTGWHRYYNTEKSHYRPFLTIGAIRWLIDKRISCLGVDLTGIEPKGGRKTQPNHKTLFKNDIPLIEALANLDKLRKQRFIAVILPLAIKGLEACPVRVIAIE
ncbi:MAG: cyclase family protein [Planctomycetes bacterium]|nr:cyclase family protein [Planctomycetota bacterium]